MVLRIANSITSSFYGTLTPLDVGLLRSNDDFFTTRLREPEATVLYLSKGMKRMLRPIQYSGCLARRDLLLQKSLRLKHGDRVQRSDASSRNDDKHYVIRPSRKRSTSVPTVYKASSL